jgi:hypothetical protein
VAFFRYLEHSLEDSCVSPENLCTGVSEVAYRARALLRILKKMDSEEEFRKALVQNLNLDETSKEFLILSWIKNGSIIIMDGDKTYIDPFFECHLIYFADENAEFTSYISPTDSGGEIHTRMLGESEFQVDSEVFNLIRKTFGILSTKNIYCRKTYFSLKAQPMKQTADSLRH